MFTGPLSEAVREARRFLIRAEELETRGHRGGYYDQQVHTAAVRRASMDLTRALAKLRKGNR